jgi:hypothetical protein
MGEAFIYFSFQPYFCFFENKFTDEAAWIHLDFLGKDFTFCVET